MKWPGSAKTTPEDRQVPLILIIIMTGKHSVLNKYCLGNILFKWSLISTCDTH